MSVATITDTTVAGRSHGAGRISAGWMFVSPAVVIMLLIGLFPFIWSLVVSLEFADSQLAGRFERYLKSGSGRAFAKRHFGAT